MLATTSLLTVSLDTEATSPFACRDSSAIFQDQMDGFLWTAEIPSLHATTAGGDVERSREDELEPVPDQAAF